MQKLFNNETENMRRDLFAAICYCRLGGYEMKNFISRITELSIPLLTGVAVALVWANVSPQSYHQMLHAELFPNVTFDFLVNDVFMAFFFALAIVEITRNLLPGGHLNPLRTAITPLLATLGGIVGPIAVFLALNHFIGAPEYARGWAIPSATDIAISWLVARLIFGAVHPAISFLLLLAIADDAIGLMIIAAFYPNPLEPVQPVWLLLVLGSMLLAWLFRSRFHITSYWPYLMICGMLSWVGMENTHLHPALSLIFIIPFLPHEIPKECRKSDAECELMSPLIKFESDFKQFVDFGLFFFGLANAGVEFTNISELTWIVFLALLVGKTLGIFYMSKLAVGFGLPLPKGISEKELFVLGMTASIGLTVALFVSGVAYIDAATIGSAKMGALFSLLNVVIIYPVAHMLNVKRVCADSSVSSKQNCC